MQGIDYSNTDIANKKRKFDDISNDEDTKSTSKVS